MNTTNEIVTGLELDGDWIEAKPHPVYRFTMSTEVVALGYGVSVRAIQAHVTNHADALIEGIHYLRHEVLRPGRNGKGKLKRVQYEWTGDGVVMLGFFVRGDQSKRFKVAAAELLLRELGWDAKTHRPEMIPEEAASVTDGGTLGPEDPRTKGLTILEFSRRFGVVPHQLKGARWLAQFRREAEQLMRAFGLERVKASGEWGWVHERFPEEVLEMAAGVTTEVFQRGRSRFQTRDNRIGGRKWVGR